MINHPETSNTNDEQPKKINHWTILKKNPNRSKYHYPPPSHPTTTVDHPHNSPPLPSETTARDTKTTTKSSYLLFEIFFLKKKNHHQVEATAGQPPPKSHRNTPKQSNPVRNYVDLWIWSEKKKWRRKWENDEERKRISTLQGNKLREEPEKMKLTYPITSSFIVVTMSIVS